MANGFLLRSYGFTATSPTTLEAGTDAAFTANDYMGMVARGATSGVDVDIRIDLGYAAYVDTIAVLNSNCGSGASAWLIAGSATNNFGAPDFSYSPGMSAGEGSSSRGFRHPMYLLPTPQTCRYWLIRIAGAGGVKPELARIVIGQRYQWAKNFGFDVSRGARDLGDVSFSPRGAMLRRRGRILRTLGLSWGFVNQSEAEAIALPFLLESVGNYEFLLACLDPVADLERSRRLYFGPLEGNLALTWRAQNIFEKRLQMVSVI